MIAYAFIASQPWKTLVNFAKKLYDNGQADVYIFVDEPSSHIYDEIHIIQLSGWSNIIQYVGNLQDKYYDMVWFLRQDVFISSNKALQLLNDAYPDCNLLIQEDADLPIPPACRMSRRLLQLVCNNMNSYEPISSIAGKNHLSVMYPAELSTIKYGAKWTLNDIKRKPNHLYYPVSNCEEHELYRHYDPDKLYLLY